MASKSHHAICRVTLITGAIGGMALAGPAHAAQNGQQISFCSENPAMAGGYAVATGTDRRGKSVTTHKIRLRGHGHCENLRNWWYQGMVVIKERYNRGGPDVFSHDTQVALAAWAFLVRPGGKWDHKGLIQRRFGGRAYKKDPQRGAFYFQWDDDLLSYEIWSNIHYGFVGRAAGIPAAVLRIGHTLPGSGATDAGDKLAVDMGIELYEREGGRQTAAEIADLIRRHRERLFATGVAEKRKGFFSS